MSVEDAATDVLLATLTGYLRTDPAPIADPADPDGLKLPAAFTFDVANDRENQGTLPKRYVVIALERVYGGDARLSGQRRVTGWRLTTRCVGVDESQVRWVRARVDRIEDERLDIAGYATGPVRFESDTATEPDRRLYSSKITWTFTTTPTTA